MSSVALESIPGKKRPWHRPRREKLASYINLALFSREQMTYLPDEDRVLYRSKHNRQEKAFDDLE